MQCLVATDCTSPSPTCNAGVCEDVKWGCLKDPDNRPPAAPGTSATLNVKVPDAVAKGPLPSVTMKPCHASTIDPKCAQTPWPTATTAYDTTTALATIGNIPNGTLYRLQYFPPPNTDYFPRDYVTNRTSRGAEMITDDLALVPAWVLDTLKPPPGIVIDKTRPFLSVRIFDCTGALAEGVSVSLTDQDATLAAAYRDEADNLDFSGTKTSTKGFMGFINVKPETSTKITARLGAADLVSFTSVPVGMHTMTVDLYPRVFIAGQ